MRAFYCAKNFFVLHLPLKVREKSINERELFSARDRKKMAENLG